MTRRVKTHIRLGIRSGSPSDQSSLPAWSNLRFLPTHREISRSFSAKSRIVSPQNVAEFLREFLRSFSAEFRGENPRRNKWLLFFSAKKIISRKGCTAAKRKKRAFFSGWSVYVSGAWSWHDFKSHKVQKHRFCKTVCMYIYEIESPFCKAFRANYIYMYMYTWWPHTFA